MNEQLESLISGAFAHGAVPDPMTVAVIGAQWGDEGKGKIVDLFAGWAEIVARGTGGANAGHTLKVGGQELVLHLIPSGIHYDAIGVVNVCGSGMVIDPHALIQEMQMLATAGLSYEHLLIAYNATLVLPQHIVLDKVREACAGAGKIGTTGRGIGPAYTDRVTRVGLVMNDLLNPSTFEAKLLRNLDHSRRLLRGYPENVVERVTLEVTGSTKLSSEEIRTEYMAYGQVLKRFIRDTDRYMQRMVGSRKILLEGAQGVLLGINDGTHPYVTSADCSLNGLACGVGLRGQDVDTCLVVAKAFYMTRVGAGPFPTELGGADSEWRCNETGTSRAVEERAFPTASVNSSQEYLQGVGIRQMGGEYGATTGRPRRTGWLDLPLLRFALKRCGKNPLLVLTKLDVLDECEEIQLCTQYLYQGLRYRVGGQEFEAGQVMEEAVMDEPILRGVKPFYSAFPGWCLHTSASKAAGDLPENLINLVQVVHHEVGSVALVSAGPEREQTVLL